jgi:hypothetical protein
MNWRAFWQFPRPEGKTGRTGNSGRKPPEPGSHSVERIDPRNGIIPLSAEPMITPSPTRLFYSASWTPEIAADVGRTDRDLPLIGSRGAACRGDRLFGISSAAFPRTNKKAVSLVAGAALSLNATTFFGSIRCLQTAADLLAVRFEPRIVNAV